MLLNYISFAIVLLAQLGIGRRLIKKEGVTAVLAGLLVIAGIVSPIAYYQVCWVKYLLWLWTAIGLLLLAYDYVIRKEKVFSDSSLKSKITFSLLFILFLFLFRGVNSTNYVYESHDLLYFSWVKDFLRADYEGPLRVSVSWPNLMASNHLLPGAVVSALSVFVINPTLVTAAEIKYIFLAFFFTGFIMSWARERQVSVAFIMILFVSAIAIYGQEFGYSLRISSFLYLLVFSELIKAVLLNGRDREIVFFALFLVIAKAPIFFVAAIVAVWYLWKAPRERFCASTIIAIVLVIFNMLGWVLAPHQPGVSMSIGVASPFSMASIFAINSVQGWFIHDVVYKFFEVKQLPVFTLILALYVLIKYYAIYFLTSPLRGLNDKRQIDLAGMNYKDRLIGLDLYVFASLFAWIFVRYDGQFAHVAHAFILMAFFTAFTLLDNFIKRPHIYKFVVLFLCAGFYGVGYSFDPFHYTNVETIRSVSAVKLSYLGNPTSDNGFYLPPSKEAPSVSQVKAAMFGLKLDSTKTPSPPDSQITYWIIKNEH